MNDLFVGNLSFGATENDLVAAFSAAGPVQSARILREPGHGGRSLGMAFVTMSDAAAARRAEKTLHRSQLGGRPIRVSCARPDDRIPRIGEP